MRLPTFGERRIVSSADLHPKHLALPCGGLDEAGALATSLGIEFARGDRRLTAPQSGAN